MPSEYATYCGIAVLAVMTYLTRITGYLIGSRIPEESRLYRIIQTLPGCALSAVVAPSLVRGTPLDAAAVLAAVVAFHFSGQILLALMTGLAISVGGSHWMGM